MELKQIDLTEQEKSKISKTARINKFKTDTTILYEKNTFEKLDAYINCFRFLYNLINNDYESSDEQKEEINKIKQKIKDFYDSLFFLYKDLLLFREKTQPNSFGEKRLKHIIEKYFLENKKQLDYLLDFVYELGKRVEQFDPDEAQGYY